MQIDGAIATGHLGLCLAEMLAEIDDQLARLEEVRALAQLDEREAAGQPLEAVCGKALRARLETTIATHKLTAARRKLVELHALLTGPVLAPAPTAAPEPAVETAAVPAPAATVTDLATARAAKATAPTRQRPALITGTARALATVGMLLLAGAGTATYIGQLGRITGLDLAATTMPATPPPTSIANAY